MSVISLDNRLEIVAFGAEFAECCKTLNDLCARFFQYINRQVFRNESEWRQCLSVFKQSVLHHSEGARSHKLAVYDQIQSFLLHPSKVVLSGGTVSRNVIDMRHVLGLVESGLPAPTCTVCKSAGGLMAKCSGKRCNAVFHVFCATSTVYCKKQSSNFYRCDSCSVKEIPHFQSAKPTTGIGSKRPGQQGHSKPKKKVPHKRKAADSHESSTANATSALPAHTAAYVQPAPVAAATTSERDADDSSTVNATSALPAHAAADVLLTGEVTTHF